jgi:hypothetical protein
LARDPLVILRIVSIGTDKQIEKFASLVVRPSELPAPPLLMANPRTMMCGWIGKLMLKLILAIWMGGWAVAFTRPKILDMVVVLSP